MCQGTENIDAQSLEDIAEKFYQQFCEEEDKEILFEKFARKSYAKYLRKKRPFLRGGIQSVEEQNRILKESDEADLIDYKNYKIHDSEYIKTVSLAWESKDWQKLAELYHLEPTQEIINHLKKISERNYNYYD